MSWLSKRLLLGHLRTGPTVLLPAKSSPAALLAVLRLADPGAQADGDDIALTGIRVKPGLELSEQELGKLLITDENQLWAHRVVADGPLPVDGFDKGLAEGIAYRLGGWAMTRGEMTDPTDDDSLGPVAYLGEMPSHDEMISLLRGHLRPAESLKPAWEKAGSAELLDGIVHRYKEDFRMYGGADILVSLAYTTKIPSAVRAVMPYAIEVVQVDVRPFEDSDGTIVLTGDEALLDTGAVALAIADAFNGLVTDTWGFQISTPEDLLPPPPPDSPSADATSPNSTSPNPTSSGSTSSGSTSSDGTPPDSTPPDATSPDSTSPDATRSDSTSSDAT
ncbi:hypothetical protein AB0O34_08400 [Sphaerisporangium sp. NPDC088356]|uniref:hypothetical protein n=1 Tax=Sphaerisporangium sp. NPDC088356 TaxID=3154871 RepID=UPI00342BF5A9